MSSEDIKKIINNGEKIDVEFKKCEDKLSKNIFETVCAFNNRNGGVVLLGVDDNKNIIGIRPENLSKIKKEFVTNINNPEKIYPPLYITPVEVKMNGKTIIYINVPRGKDVCRVNGKIFDRSYEGDINITNNSHLVFKLYSRMQNTYFVNKVYPNLSFDHLDPLLIDRARKMACSRNKDHMWKDMNDIELLRSVNLIATDSETNKEGMTLAAILLFGTDNIIMSVLPQYKTDAIFRIINKDRYDDREVIITNLIDSYYKLIEFGKKHLNDLFVLDGVLNVNARDRILREIISNTLAHRDFSSGYVAKMIIDDKNIIVENSNIAHGFGKLDIKKIEPFAKNPTISKVFREIGLADELGSGMKNTYKYTRLYSGKNPIFDEADIFKTTIPLKQISTLKVGGQNTQKLSIKEQIVEMIKNDNKVTRKQLAINLNVSTKTIQRAIVEIRELEYVGVGKNGCWVFKNDEDK